MIQDFGLMLIAYFVTCGLALNVIIVVPFLISLLGENLGIIKQAWHNFRVG